MNIKIRYYGKEFTVPATPVGKYLAVHPTYTNAGRRAGRSWSVTHVPTGMGIETGGLSLKRQAVRYAELIRDLDWDFKSPADPKFDAIRLGPMTSYGRAELLARAITEAKGETA